VADRVRFQYLDATRGLPARYDIITSFDVVHDAIDPRGMLRAIREALEPDGVYLCLETNCSDKLHENVGPLGTLFHGISLFYCLPMSLAHSGEGLGKLGLPEPKLREPGTSRSRRPGTRRCRRAPSRWRIGRRRVWRASRRPRTA
jgi:hypothetical protein